VGVWLGLKNNLEGLYAVKGQLVVDEVETKLELCHIIHEVW
jgi:hypothetical protein